MPLFVKQVHAQRKMAQHAPHLQELRKKYKDDKQRLNEETMKFYKENGVNPLAGCLPMIPQMIVFFALFNVLRTIADWKPGTGAPIRADRPGGGKRAARDDLRRPPRRQAAVLAPDAPLHVCIVIALTVVISATTTFMTVRQSAKRGLMQTNVDPDNPMAQSQKYMQYIVPFFSLTGLYWQYGLVLYWVTTNVWTLGQQYFMFRNWTTEETGAAGALARGDHRRHAGRAGLAAGPDRCQGGEHAAARPGGQHQGQPGHWHEERHDAGRQDHRSGKCEERRGGECEERHRESRQDEPGQGKLGEGGHGWWCQDHRE